jgi:hypothetical protein
LPGGRPPDAGYQSGYHGRPAPARMGGDDEPASGVGVPGVLPRDGDATRRPDAAAALTTSRDDRANSPCAGGDRRREDRRSGSSPAPPGGRARHAGPEAWNSCAGSLPCPSSARRRGGGRTKRATAATWAAGPRPRRSLTPPIPLT